MGAEYDTSNKSINILNKFYIWIDQKINNSENYKYAEYLYKNYSQIQFFNNIKDAMKFLKKIEFNLTYIIVSGSLFKEFIFEIKSIENKIFTAPKIIIFTSELTKT